MLRIEQGVEASLFTTTDQELKSYAEHHGLVLPSIAAYDLYNRGLEHQSMRERITKVGRGLERSATLCLMLDNIDSAPINPGWIELSKTAVFNEVLKPENDWRVMKVANDGHTKYPDYGIWSATRNLAKFDDFRIRERYTVAANSSTDEEEIKDMIIVGKADSDMLIATATVYALNKSVSKPGLEKGETDWSKFPNLYELLQNNR